MNNLKGGLSILFTVFFLVACTSSSVSIVDEYNRPNSEKVVQNVLVIGVNDDTDAALDFESRLVDELAAKNVSAMAAHKELASRQLSRESIIDIVLNKNIDGVIVARLVATKKESVTTEKRYEFKFEEPSPEKLTEAIVTRYQQVSSETSTDTVATVFLTADLYSTDKEDNNRLWGIKFIIEDKRSRAEILDEAVKLIDTKLSADGFVK